VEVYVNSDISTDKGKSFVTYQLKLSGSYAAVKLYFVERYFGAMSFEIDGLTKGGI
jgi:hypothetical protein